jgi:hypothetical protein
MIDAGQAQQNADRLDPFMGGCNEAYSHGRPLAKGTAFEMDEKVPAGQHRVEVKVSDKSGRRATQR